MKQIAIGVLALLLYATVSQAVDLGFEAGIGISISSDYQSVVKDAYPGSSVSGAGAMMSDLHIGVPIAISENIVVAPTITLLISFVAVTYDYGTHEETDSYSNTVIVPALAARYYLSGRKNSSPYFEAEVNANSPHSGKSDRYKFSSGGTGYGIFGGYHIAMDNLGVNIELGYRYLPVEVDAWNSSKETKNFGGFAVRTSITF